MSEEEEDKPKPEGEQQPRAREEELREELKQRREDLSGKSLDELYFEIFAEAEKIIQQLAEEKNDREEIIERINHLDLLQIQFHFEFKNKLKEVGDYSKWARVLEAGTRVSLVVERRNIKERKKNLDKRPCGFDNVENLKELAGRKNLSLGEIAQLHTLDKLDGMIWENYKFTTEAKMGSAKDSIPVIRFQAEVAEVMLAVRERLESSEQVQAKTAKILEKVEGRLESSEQLHRETATILEGVKENTNPERQILWLVLVSSLSVIGAPLFQKHGIPFLEEHPLRALLWTSVLVFAGLEIINRVKKKRR